MVIMNDNVGNFKYCYIVDYANSVIGVINLDEIDQRSSITQILDRYKCKESDCHYMLTTHKIDHIVDLTNRKEL